MKTISCEVCGSNQHQFLLEGWDRVFGIPGVFRIVRCRECGLIFINPQVELEVLKDYYPSEYYNPRLTSYREYSWLKKKVMEDHYGYKSSSNYSKKLGFLRKIGSFPLKYWYRDTIPFIEYGRLLDVGCGNGTELYKLKKMGWETYGVEMGEEASNRAQLEGLSVFTGNLFEASFPDQFFHVVRMSFVLEHLPNPKETLMEVKRILQPHGRVYISIQNARSLNFWLFKGEWFSLDVPRHLFSFSPKTIERLMSSVNLEIKNTRYSSGTRTFLVSLQYWLNARFRKGKKTKDNPIILTNRLMRALSRPPCWVIDRLRLGDLIHLEVMKA